MPSESFRNEVTEFLRTLQDDICKGIADCDGTAFREDLWQRDGGGGGRTRVLSEGNIFEKAGVNFSAVHGASPNYLKTSYPNADRFYAAGVSLVIHPASPKIPTVHSNFRYFELSDGTAWFGGGIDLTPYYLDENDAIAFHTTIKETCDKHDIEYYPTFKKWCDEYFYIKHRKEARGIGGIFFDHLGSNGSIEHLYAFITDIANSFLPAYLPIVERHRNEYFTADQKHWQLIRRGRYVEFNLVYDKGTTFGLETGGRTESILMSLPPEVRWEYDVHPEERSEEQKLIAVLQSPRQWTESTTEKL